MTILPSEPVRQDDRDTTINSRDELDFIDSLRHSLARSDEGHGFITLASAIEALLEIDPPGCCCHSDLCEHLHHYWTCRAMLLGFVERLARYHRTTAEDLAADAHTDWVDEQAA